MSYRASFPLPENRGEGTGTAVVHVDNPNEARAILRRYVAFAYGARAAKQMSLWCVETGERVPWLRDSTHTESKGDEG